MLSKESTHTHKVQIIFLLFISFPIVAKNEQRVDNEFKASVMDCNSHRWQNLGEQ